MITDYKNKKLPEVQVVMDMDGFGSRVLKIDLPDLYL
jgi:hypothetical protein